MGRTRGRPKGGRISLGERLASPTVGQVTYLSEKHKMMARLVAMGVTKKAIAIALGMTEARVVQVTNSPACQQMIAEYAGTDEVEDATIGAVSLAAQISQQSMVRAALLQADILTEIEGEAEKKPFSSKVNQIFESSADRVGFSRHHTQTNINVDFAADLERAIRESQKAKTIVVAQGSSPVMPAHEGDRVLCQRLLSPSILLSGEGATGMEVRGDPPSPIRRRA